jgi:hypothetical protein
MLVGDSVGGKNLGEDSVEGKMLVEKRPWGKGGGGTLVGRQ